MSKIIYLNGRFLTQPITGVQRVAFELVLALDELLEEGSIPKNEQTFFLIYSGKLVNSISLKHIKLLKKGFLQGNLWEQIELPMYTYGCLLLSFCTISCLIKRKQIVFIHDASVFVNPSFFTPVFRIWYKFALIWLSKTARCIITVSEFSKNELVKHAGFKRHAIKVIYNAGEHILKNVEPDFHFKTKISNLKPYCLAVSSLSLNKNFNGLSEAIVKSDFKKYNMLIAGGTMSTLKVVDSSDNVTYLGYVSDAELKFLYCNAALFIFPSFYEGFGIPPIEAMLSGCPVMASATSSLPEILGNACYYFDPNDTTEIAEIITRLLENDNERTKLREIGYIQAEKYNWKKSALELYNISISYW
ncbi:glycosyltransferase family 4 protein [Mucilaginibacter sp.]|uniref:glycosyltransferase family 4 protein n=1 Tax=Mucilaginibacter sp. TaxID=1882438 RepID=UPI003D0D0358